MLSNEYIAGFFDGEGCITISKIAPRDKHPAPRYQLHVSIVQKRAAVLYQIQEQFGGRIYKHVPGVNSYPANHACSVINWPAKQAWAFLEAMYPFLVVKKKEAEVAFEFMKTLRYYQPIRNTRSPLTEAEITTREQFRLALKALKKEGD